MEAQYQNPSDIFPQTNQVVYAGFWERFAASLIDGLIVGVPVAILRFAMGDFDYPNNAGFVAMYTSLGSLLNIVVSWLYSALQESSAAQATIGKRALGIKVTNTEGGRISFAKATGRHFGKILSTIILFIGYLMMLWDSKKQTLHDKLANTLVVK